MWKKLPEDYVLHIYGAGSYEEEVKLAVSENSNIVFYGFQPQSVIFEDMVKSIAVLITSELYETFGMSIPESFALGTPVICTNLGNPKQMIEESKAGVTYDIDDFDSFLTALNKVSADRDRYSFNAQRYFNQALSHQVNYERLRDIYDQARIIL